MTLSNNPDGHLITRFPTAPEDLAPGEALEFSAMATNATTDRQITISWRVSPEPASEAGSFKFPLPRRSR